MKNLLFFLWLMFYPLIDDIADAVRHKFCGEKPQEDSENNWQATLLTIAFYFGIAYLLYQK